MQVTILRQLLAAVAILCCLSNVASAELFYTAYPNSGVSRVDEVTGEGRGTLAPTTGYRQGFDDFVGLTVGPDRLLYVSARYYDDSRFGRWGVFRFDLETDRFLGSFINGGSLYDIAFGPDGDLYGVYGALRGDLVRYDGETGQPKGRVLEGDDFGYYGVGTFTFLPDGSLFVATGDSEIARYDPMTGERTGPVTSLIELGLDGFRFEGMTVGPDGNAYVAYNYRGRDQILDGGILRFDGSTGAFLDIVLSDIPAFGAASGGSLGVAFAPNGDIFVGSRHASALLRYDATSGMLLGEIPLPSNSGGASYLVFHAIPEPCGAGLAVLASLPAIIGYRRRASEFSNRSASRRTAQKGFAMRRRAVGSRLFVRRCGCHSSSPSSSFALARDC